MLSPLKYVEALGVPVAFKSAVTVTSPSVAVFGVKSINVPSVVVSVSTMLEGTVKNSVWSEVNTGSAPTDPPGWREVA